MPDASAQVEIPKRALFKAAEVCDLAKVQPYVLRSWEAEFPDLGVAKSAGAPRVYRRSDVEQVLRIRHLLLVEGLTLAGARRRLDEETAPVAAESPAIEELIGQNARERLTAVKRGLQSILDLLANVGHGHGEFRLAPPPVAKSSPARSRSMPVERAKPARGKPSASRHGSSARSPQARRNRSA
jgi:DNA-binding transcriptional MerR regulator